MKKLIVFVLLLICFAVVIFAKNDENAIFNIDNISKVCLISSQDCVEAETVECGDKYFNYCSLSAAKGLYEQIEVDGVQLYLNDYSFDKFKADYRLQVVSILENDEIKIVNAYSPYFEKSIMLNGKKINVQVAVYENYLLAGFPMILTGY